MSDKLEISPSKISKYDVKNKGGRPGKAKNRGRKKTDERTLDETQSYLSDEDSNQIHLVSNFQLPSKENKVHHKKKTKTRRPSSEIDQKFFDTQQNLLGAKKNFTNQIENPIIINPTTMKFVVKCENITTGLREHFLKIIPHREKVFPLVSKMKARNSPVVVNSGKLINNLLYALRF